MAEKCDHSWDLKFFSFRHEKLRKWAISGNKLISDFFLKKLDDKIQNMFLKK